MKKWIKELVSSFGYKIVRKQPEYVEYPFAQTQEGMMIEVLQRYQIDLLIDVGASYGYWAKKLRTNGFGGDIISFEPQPLVFNELLKQVNLDNKWKAFAYALGDRSEEIEMNISDYTPSSSMSAMCARHVEAMPETQYTNTQIVEVKTLDEFWHKECQNHTNIFVKLDVQGFENKVLDGGKNALANIKCLQLEMAFTKLYEDDLCFFEMFEKVKSYGFNVAEIFSGFKDEKTGELLQADVIFYR